MDLANYLFYNFYRKGHWEQLEYLPDEIPHQRFILLVMLPGTQFLQSYAFFVFSKFRSRRIPIYLPCDCFILLYFINLNICVY